MHNSESVAFNQGLKSVFVGKHPLVLQSLLFLLTTFLLLHLFVELAKKPIYFLNRESTRVLLEDLLNFCDVLGHLVTVVVVDELVGLLEELMHADLPFLLLACAPDLLYGRARGLVRRGGVTVDAGAGGERDLVERVVVEFCSLFALLLEPAHLADHVD